jgi:hypothetical protein
MAKALKNIKLLMTIPINSLIKDMAKCTSCDSDLGASSIIVSEGQKE